jgi:tetratricopeptide (TPR) repeat protein
MKHALVVLFALAPAIAFADPQSDARAHIQKATALHGEAKFAEALEELKRAFALDPKPELLYAMGQVHVQLGDCAQAIVFYERYLDTKPAAGPSAATREAIESCKSAPPPEPPPEPQPTPPPPAPVAQPVASPWYEDVIGDALVGGGVVSGVLSIVFYRQMSAKLEDAESATTYEGHQAARADAASKRNVSLVFGISGVALVGAGVTRYMLRDTGERPRKVTVAPTTGGGVIAVTGRF